jgi:hypothetical protein
MGTVTMRPIERTAGGVRDLLMFRTVTPSTMRRLATVDERYQSYNVEMAEVIGGNFWKPCDRKSQTSKPASAQCGGHQRRAKHRDLHRSEVGGDGKGLPCDEERHRTRATRRRSKRAEASIGWRRIIDAYNSARRSNCALIATMTVLADISTAANAGGRRIPCAAMTPAANGIATML